MARRPSKDGKYRYELVLDPQSDADLVQLLEGNKDHGTSYTITMKACMRGQLMPLIQQSLAHDGRQSASAATQPSLVANGMRSAAPSVVKTATPTSAGTALDPSAVAKLLGGDDIKQF